MYRVQGSGHVIVIFSGPLHAIDGYVECVVCLQSCVGVGISSEQFNKDGAALEYVSKGGSVVE